MISEIIGSDEQPRIYSPDHLLRLVQQVKAHYIETSVAGKAGRPRTYSQLSFLFGSRGCHFTHFQSLELHRLLEKDFPLRQQLGFETTPHRRII